MKYLILILILFLSVKINAADTLKVEKPKIVSLKTNLALLLMRGFSFESEFVLSKRIGLWTEISRHREAHSVYNVALKETAILTGINCYSLFKGLQVPQAHNGMYVGPYLKFKHGYYDVKEDRNYAALFLGMQAGMQTVFKNNITFSMGMGVGVGYFTVKKEIPFTSLFERYRLPTMDFRGNVCLGYMF
ncbi:MAG: hypothetical protein ACXVC6_00940 [Bacteroidia bacterium]